MSSLRASRCCDSGEADRPRGAFLNRPGRRSNAQTFRLVQRSGGRQLMLPQFVATHVLPAVGGRVLHTAASAASRSTYSLP
jgi:hypothetical protein